LGESTSIDVLSSSMKGQVCPPNIKFETMIDRKVKSFQNAWLENYGIRITASFPMTSEVLSAVYQFCDSFGAEDNNNPDCKQKRTSSICYFKKPWQSDHMMCHCDTFHPSRFGTLNSLNIQKENNFFKETGKNAMLKLLSKPAKAESIYCTFGIPTIDVIMAELLLEPMIEEEETTSTMKQKPYLSSNSVMQTLNTHTTLFTFQMLYSFS
jgi:hypothetical protein